MLRLNQFSVTWNNSESRLTIQSKVGEKGIYTNLSEEPRKLSAYTERQNNESVPRIQYIENNESFFYPLMLREEASYYLSVCLPGDKDNIQETNFIFKNTYLQEYIDWYPKEYWKEYEISGAKYTEFIGEINTGSFVGILDLSISDEESFICEVSARKIDYQKDYQSFLNEIAEESSNLIMQFGGGSHLNFDSNNDISSHFNKLIHLRNVMKDLPEAAETVLKNFHNKLVSESVKMPTEKVNKPDTFEIATNPSDLALEEGGILKEKFSGYTPKQLIETTKHETIDTVENRYIKNFLEELHHYCYSLKGTIEQYINSESQNRMYNIYIEEVNGWLSIIEDYLYQPAFRHINRMVIMPMSSQVLQHREGYKDILLMDLKLQSGLDLSWSAMEAVDNEAYVRPIYDLYEIWCFFKIRNALIEMLGREKSTNESLYREEKGGINFNLKKGKKSCHVFENNDLKVYFYYNKEFSINSTEDKSYSLKFKPDYSLYIIRHEAEKGFFVHFDAKYKIDNMSNVSSEIYSSKKEDIVKMHAYKDGILNTLGSFILYPGNDHKVFPESEGVLPGVGAIPLKPNDNIKLKETITEIIDFVQKLDISNDYIGFN